MNINEETRKDLGDIICLMRDGKLPHEQKEDFLCMVLVAIYDQLEEIKEILYASKNND